MRRRGEFREKLRAMDTREEVEQLLQAYAHKARRSVESRICCWSRRATERIREMEKNNGVVTGISS